MNLLNSTPFAADIAILPDDRGADTLVVVVKGTWTFADNGIIEPAQEQVQVIHEPVYVGEPGASTLLHDTDFVLKKPSTDCILLGHAYGNGARDVDVTFAVGPVRKTVRIFGERIWMKCLGKVQMSRPVPFEKMSLVYERSFGGRDESHRDPVFHEVCAENPVGRGLIASKSQFQIDNMRLPNLEDPRSLIRTPKDRPRPAGFAPIPREWLPRAAYAGTCDTAWRKTRFPLPPLDLNQRFYSCAPEGQLTPKYLEGNERVLVEGASRHGRLLFELPEVRLEVRIRVVNQVSDVVMVLDTLVVEPDEERVTLTWRGNLSVHGRLHDIHWVEISS